MSNGMRDPSWRPWSFVSGSQIDNFDVAKNPKNACIRRWGLEKVFGRKPPEKPWQRLGTDLHAQIEGYYLHGKPITSPIVQAGMIYAPPRGPQLRVEQWFSCEIPGWPDDRKKEITESGWPIGYGRFTGRSDLCDMSGTAAIVIDFKNLSDINSAKKPQVLADSPPMIGYAYWALTNMPASSSVVLKHIVNATKTACKNCKQISADDAATFIKWFTGLPATAGMQFETSERSRNTRSGMHAMLTEICSKLPEVMYEAGITNDVLVRADELRSNLNKTWFTDSAQSTCTRCNVQIDLPAAKEVRVELTRDDVFYRWDQTIKTIHQMRSLSVIRDWRDYPANKKACMSYGGCPHRDLCYGSAALPPMPDFPPGPPDDYYMQLPESSPAEMREEETMQHQSPELSGVFIGLSRIFNENKIPDGQTCGLYVEAMKAHVKTPTVPLPLLPEAQTHFDYVVDRMSRLRNTLIGWIGQQLQMQAGPDEGLMASLRPLQSLYSVYAQLAQQGCLPAAQTAAFNLMRHEAEDMIMAALRARKEQSAAQVPPPAQPAVQMPPALPPPQALPQPQIVAPPQTSPVQQPPQAPPQMQAPGPVSGPGPVPPVAPGPAPQDAAQAAGTPPGTMPGLCVLIDTRPVKMSAAFLSGRKVIDGSQWIQQFKDKAAREYRDKDTGAVGVPHYRDIRYGAGTMTVVTHARAAIISGGPVILCLDAADEVQAELGRALSGIAEMCLRGTR